MSESHNPTPQDNVKTTIAKYYGADKVPDLYGLDALRAKAEARQAEANPHDLLLKAEAATQPHTPEPISREQLEALLNDIDSQIANAPQSVGDLTYLEIVEAQIKFGKYSQAKENISKILLDPLKATGWAHLAVASGDKQYIQEALMYGGDNYEAIREISIAQAKLGMLDEARSTANKLAAVSNIDFAHAYTAIALQSQSEDDIILARGGLTALSEAHDHIQVYENFAYTATKLGHPEVATELLDRLVMWTINGNLTVKCRQEMIRAYLEKNQLSQARREAKSNINSHLLIADVTHSDQDIASARELIVEMITLDMQSDYVVEELLKLYAITQDPQDLEYLKDIAEQQVKIQNKAKVLLGIAFATHNSEDIVAAKEAVQSYKASISSAEPTPADEYYLIKYYLQLALITNDDTDLANAKQTIATHSDAMNLADDYLDLFEIYLQHNRLQEAYELAYTELNTDFWVYGQIYAAALKLLHKDKAIS